jgi:hypothetical protein
VITLQDVVDTFLNVEVLDETDEFGKGFNYGLIKGFFQRILQTRTTKLLKLQNVICGSRPLGYFILHKSLMLPL